MVRFFFCIATSFLIKHRVPEKDFVKRFFGKRRGNEKMPAMRRRRIAGVKKYAPTTSRSSILEEIISKKRTYPCGAFFFCIALRGLHTSLRLDYIRCCATITYRYADYIQKVVHVKKDEE